MNFLKNIVSGFAWGIGFSLAFVFIMYSAQYIDKQNKPPRQETKLSLQDVERIESKVESLNIVEGRIILSISIANTNSFPVEDIWLGVTILKGEQEIESCDDFDTHELDANKTSIVTIYCRGKWERILKDQVTAVSRVDRALRAKIK